LPRLDDAFGIACGSAPGIWPSGARNAAPVQFHHGLLGRRAFLEAAVVLPAAVRAGARSAMKLSLSARVAESFGSKEKTTLSLDELIGLARAHGYAALCMRASQAGVHTDPEIVRAMRGRIDAAGLRVSMVTGDFAVPANDERGPECLRRIGPYLDLAERLGADLIRVCMKKEGDIVWARRAADEARERRIRLAHQSHCASLFETVEGSIEVLRGVDRENFGIIYEAANWMLAAEDYGRGTIRRLVPWLFNVYVQNHRLSSDGAGSVKTWKRGPVRFDHIGLWESGGVDLDEVFGALGEVGYRGFVTVHQAFAGVMPVEESVRRSAECLKRYVG
jgi:sugar phosphate isomerase/epimerase